MLYTIYISQSNVIIFYYCYTYTYTSIHRISGRLVLMVTNRKEICPIAGFRDKFPNFTSRAYLGRINFKVF